ncbi:toxin glutamine deamidase domain-containing protein [Streptomyces sp. NPDC006134]|uniref:toxin glutamine deamidase domain-containing protein n=1 Tax=Streptomyces sp. NPDC006134 TaxID=3154467 RepID=UPI0033EE2A73
MMLPDELEWVLQMLGYNWPTADEDKLRESAQLWRTFGDDVTGLHTAANASARTVIAHNAGESIDAFTKTYAKFDGGSGGGDGYLADAAQAAYIIASVLEACAYLVEFAKWAVIAQLIALAIEIAAAQVAAPFTFGLSEVAALGATQATRLIVRRLLDELKQALMEAIVEAMKEPAISAVEAMITDLVRQSVNVGFGAQQGFDLTQTVSAGARGGWEAVKQTPQTLVEGVRDSLGQKAGNRFHHAIDSRIDGYGGTPGTSGAAGADGGDGGSGGDSGSGSTRSTSGSAPTGSDSPSSFSTRSDAGSGPGADIGGGISADSSGSRVGVPDVGAGPDSGPGSGSGQSPASSDTSYPKPTPSHSGPSLSDFDEPAPGGTSSNASGSSSSSGASGSAGPSPSGGGSSISSLSSPTPHSAPAPTSSGGTSSPSGGGAISTSIDSLAAGIPTQSNTTPAPATTDASPSGGSGRTDGGSTMPASPTPPSHAGGTAGTRPGAHTPGGTPSTTSPTLNTGPARNSSTTAPGAPSAATGTGLASTPNPTSPTTPRTIPTPDSRIPGTADGRAPGIPDSRIPTQRTPGNAPDGNTTPRSTPDAAGGPRTHGPNTDPAPGTAPAPSQHPTQTTPHQNPAQASPSRSASPSAGTPTTTPSTSTGIGSDRASVPNSRTSNAPAQPGPTTGPAPQSTPSGQHQPGTGPARSPQQPAANTPSTPSTPQQPAAHPHTPPQNTPHTQQQVAAVPLHTLTPTPGPAASPPHAAPATSQPPGSPATTPSPQQPQQDSLETIRAGLNHTPGGLTPPDPADQQALADAVPHTEDGTPQRFPDPFGPWTQLQNDGGNTVPGRSNNCADCSRSFLETWYGNPQVSAPRTTDPDEHGNPDPWSPEHNANANQIRWTGAAHTYAGPGGDPDTAHTIASTLQQAGHGAAAIVQVDWPGGGGHAFNAVNHHGTIIWIDTQSGDVSHTPLHLDQAAHVWHIPLDPNRQPIDTTQPPTQNTEDTENHGQPENNHTPQNDTSGKDSSHHPSPAPSRPAPLPVIATRDTTPPGGVTHPSPAEQQALVNAVPRDENGDPIRPPDPADGPWVQRINGAGTDALGRTNNCVDVALSTVDTYAGTPTAAAARTPDPGPDGTPSDRGERNGRDRIENTLGARFTDLGDGRDAFNRLEDTLRTSGHGSQAVIITQDANGRAHAWNAVNHNGRITYIDAQVGRTSPRPLHHGTDGVFAIPLGPNRQPVTLEVVGSQPRPDVAARPDQAERQAPKKPSGTSQGPNSDTKGEDPHPKDDPARKNHPRLSEPESDTSTHYGMAPMEHQAELRRTNDVRQVDLDPVHQQLNDWLTPVPNEDGSGTRIPLVDALQSCSPPRPDDPDHKPVILRHDDLVKILPGFADMHPGERGAVIASLARLSHNFHASHAVGASPEPKDDYASRGERAHAGASWKASHRDDDELREAIQEEFAGIAKALEASGEHRPDFTGRNYAAVEVYDPVSKKITYMVDSSYPNPDGKHSEKNLLDYLKTVNEGRAEEDAYQPLSMYSDREPCGHGQGYANCAKLLSDEMQGIDVFYGTGYRKNAEITDSGLTPAGGYKKQFDKDLAENLAELGKIWVRVMGEGGLKSSTTT